MDVIDLLQSNSPTTSSPGLTDIVFVKRVHIQAAIQEDAWGKNKPQPVYVSAKIPFSVKNAAHSDHISDALDYRSVYKKIRSFDAGSSNAETVQHFASLLALGHRIIDELGQASGTAVELEAPKGLLHANGVLVRLEVASGKEVTSVMAVKEMHIPCIIGIGDLERKIKQPVIVDFAFLGQDFDSMASMEKQGYFKALLEAFDVIESSQFWTLEAFVTAVAKFLITRCDLDHVAISARKPSVFSMADGPGVQILRHRSDFNA